MTRKGSVWMTHLTSVYLQQTQVKDFQSAAPFTRVSHCRSVEIAYVTLVPVAVPVS